MSLQYIDAMFASLTHLVSWNLGVHSFNSIYYRMFTKKEVFITKNDIEQWQKLVVLKVHEKVLNHIVYKSRFFMSLLHKTIPPFSFNKTYISNICFYVY